MVRLGKTRPATEVLKDGLSILGVLDAMKLNATRFRKVFCHQKRDLAIEFIDKMFEIKRSEAESNNFLTENRVIMYWRDYLEDIAEKESVCTFKELIAFCTGSEKVALSGNDDVSSFSEEGK
eukprot:gene21194-23276_t